MKSVLLEMFSKERVPVESINYILCDDEFLLQINQQFLQHDDLTDIITFDLSEPRSGSSIRSSGKTQFGKVDSDRHKRSALREHSKANRLLTAVPKQGEIYISVERVQDNAAVLGISREEELRRVMFHGCLHLCGYKDKLNEDKALMRKMEDKYLRLYNLRST